MKPKNLQQRIALFVLIPVFFILAGMGWASFLYARNAIIKQWSETATSKLQKASHLFDMRLMRAKDLLRMFKDNEEQSLIVQQFILKELEQLDGVVEVNHDFPQVSPMESQHEKMHQKRSVRMHVKKISTFDLSLPKYNSALDGKTVSLTTSLINRSGEKIGQIEVVLSFQDLIDEISKENWWKSNKTFLIDNEGNILASNQQTFHGKTDNQFSKFELSSPLAQKTLNAIKQESFGTVFGSGHPPKEISGYYHLKEAPWSLVLISPGREILQSILKFRTFYFVTGLIAILSVVLFIRMSISGTTNAIKKVSEAARELADGHFTGPLPVLSKDEVGILTFNFNRMTKQLKERIDLKTALNLAKEVQQSLLPPTNITFKNLEISGRSVYCDETGGDFFDIIEFPNEPEKICVAVGDVVGHGVGAALLMATTRALLRGRIIQGGSLSQVINDVNRLLCLDSQASGSFVTLFVLLVDTNKKEIRWIRAGHDPAIAYHPDRDSFKELFGNGLALGVDEDFWYEENIYSDIQQGTQILIGTDGAWEAENNLKERFGKKRIEIILQETADSSSEKVVNKIINEIEMFRSKAKQDDDITLLSIKFL